MNNKLNKNPEIVEKDIGVEAPQKSSEGKDVEVQKTLRTVSEGVNVLSESPEEGDGVFSEEEKRYGGDQKQSAAGTQGVSGQARIVALPPIEEMIKQTVAAIEIELQKSELEMKAMLKNKKISAHQLNDQVRKIRFLNNLLSKLRRAAKLAEEFIVGLWKQYVKKI